MFPPPLPLDDSTTPAVLWSIMSWMYFKRILLFVVLLDYFLKRLELVLQYIVLLQKKLRKMKRHQEFKHVLLWASISANTKRAHTCDKYLCVSQVKHVCFLASKIPNCQGHPCFYHHWMCFPGHHCGGVCLCQCSTCQSEMGIWFLHPNTEADKASGMMWASYPGLHCLQAGSLNAPHAFGKGQLSKADSLLSWRQVRLMHFVLLLWAFPPTASASQDRAF